MSHHAALCIECGGGLDLDKAHYGTDGPLSDDGAPPASPMHGACWEAWWTRTRGRPPAFSSNRAKRVGSQGESEPGRMVALSPSGRLDTTGDDYPEGTRARCSECLAFIVYHDGAWFDPGTGFLHVTLGGLGVVS